MSLESPSQDEPEVESKEEAPPQDDAVVERKETVPWQNARINDHHLWLERQVLNMPEGRVDREEVRKFSGEGEQEGEDELYRYRKSFTYEGALLVRETGDDHEGNVWEKSFEYDEKGRMVREEGENTAGPSQGHKWQKVWDHDNVMAGNDIGTILEQGQNPAKPDKGHTWEIKFVGGLGRR